MPRSRFSLFVFGPAAFAAAALLLSGCDQGHDHGPGGHEHESAPETSGGDEAPATTEKADDGYPLDTCVVSGKKLGSMGEPVVIAHEGRTVKLCCGGCEDPFKKDPAKYLSKLDAAKKSE